VADATKLEGLDSRFDTVVDCAFYHVFATEPELQKSYAQALHRATKPGALLFMFEFRRTQRQRLQDARSLSETISGKCFPAAGWEITYLGPTTYQGNISVETFDMMAARNPDTADEMKPLLERMRVIEPWLIDGRIHMPFWELHARRVD